MRNRVIQLTIKQHLLDINNAKALSRAKLDKALAIDEISIAYSKYSKACFADIMNDVDNSPSTKVAYNEYITALKNNGFSISDFEYTPSCKKCDDSGFVGKEVCSCIWDKFVDNLKRECEIDERAKFSFGDCNLSLIKDEEQRAQIQKLYSLMRAYVDKYPSVKKNTILLSGGVGVGKTSLASSIARGIVNKGYAVKIVSAYEFVSLMLKVHTSPIIERASLMNDVLNADALLIDDLGTEPMLRNVTVEYLLMVLEERQNANRTTIITTNLDSNRILQIYGERVYSRLHHKQIALSLEISGKDLRTN